MSKQIKTLMFCGLSFIVLPSLLWGQLPELTDDVTLTTPVNDDTVYYKYNQTNTRWAAVGVRSTNSANTNWNIALYTDTLFTTLVAESNGAGADEVEFVVCDYNHSPTGWEGIRVDAWAYTPPVDQGKVEYEDNVEQLTAPGTYGPYAWDVADVVEMTDIIVNTPGRYRFVLDVTKGSVDMGMALFRSNGAAYYGNRDSAVALSDARVNGGDESFLFNAEAADRYGLLLWANNEPAPPCSFRLLIETVEIYTLVDDDTALTPSGYDTVWYQYNQTTTHWAVTGLRPLGSGNNWDIALYSDPTFSNLLASSFRVGEQEVDFVVVDYNQSPLGWEGVKATWNGDATHGQAIVEYENANDSLIVGSNGPFNWPTSDVVEIWDVKFNQAGNYRITTDITSGVLDLNMAFYVSPGIESYYKARDSAYAMSRFYGNGGDESFALGISSSDVTDRYGLVVWNEPNAQTGDYNINITPYGLIELHEDVVDTADEPGFLCKFNQTDPHWAVVGWRRTASGYWKINLYTDTILGITNSVAGPSTIYNCDFVVADYNHSPLGWEGVSFRYDGVESGIFYPATVEYEAGNDSLIIGVNGPFEWPAGDVVEIWDVYLEAIYSPFTKYDFTCDILTPTLNLDIYLYSSNGAPYYSSRSGYVAKDDNGGNGVDESFSYWIPYGKAGTDRYGLVVRAPRPAPNDSGSYQIIISASIGIEEQKVAPQLKTFSLSQNLPNPAVGRTVIEYTIPEHSKVKLDVLDVTGRHITTLVNKFQEPGQYQVYWNSAGLPAGVYFYRLKAGDYTEIKKAIICK